MLLAVPSIMTISPLPSNTLIPQSMVNEIGPTIDRWISANDIRAEVCDVLIMKISLVGPLKGLAGSSLYVPSV